MPLEAFHLPAADGRRFCLLHRPEPGQRCRGAIVYVHPFAEEMNKSRRMAALQARALARAGYLVLQIDLHGCGESSGDFGDASWDGWIADVTAACAWLAARSEADLWLWGLRVGGLVAAAAAARLDRPSRLLLWQPVLAGKQYLQQFLRLKIAAEMSGSGSAGLMERLRAQLSQGEAVEIAGYTLSAALASGLEGAELLPPPQSQRIELIEISARTDAGLSPAAAARLEQWRQAGHAVRARQVSGAAFWQSVEICECPALLAASEAALADGAPV